MKKLIPYVDKCINQYKPCWAGDVKVALCLRDAGVTIHDIALTFPGFHSNPPEYIMIFMIVLMDSGRTLLVVHHLHIIIC